MGDINKGRLLGAHCSSAGGLARAVRHGSELSCAAIQFFTKNSNQWQAVPLSNAEIDAFKEALSASNIKIAFAHTGYLINLAAIDPAVHADSIMSMRLELERAEALELPYLVVHPGSHKEAGELVGIIQAVFNLRLLMDEFRSVKVEVVLETTAGQGTGLGWRFDHFAEIFDRLGWPKNTGICVDTAHIFQAGYDITTKKGYDDTIREIDETVGLGCIRAFHLNDSKTVCGSRVDRHEHVGKGKIGVEPFRRLLNDRRFAKIPMVIETPKGTTLAEDAENLALLRSLITLGTSEK